MKPCNKIYKVMDKNTGEMLYSIDTNKTLIMEIVEHEQH